METFFASLALCAGNSPGTDEFYSQRPVTRSFDVFFSLRQSKRLSKKSWGWWFERPSAHYDVIVMIYEHVVSCKKKMFVFSWLTPFLPHTSVILFYFPSCFAILEKVYAHSLCNTYYTVHTLRVNYAMQIYHLSTMGMHMKYGRNLMCHIFIHCTPN